MKNTAVSTPCEELHYSIAKYAQEMGEEWRIGKGTEIMDSLQAHESMLGVLVSEVPLEILELGAAETQFTSRTIRIRCVGCQGIMHPTLEELKRFLVFYRKDKTVSMKNQWRFKVPFLKKEITLTLWKIEDAFLPKNFIS